MISSGHIPVLLEETLTVLSLRSGGNYLDCTFGGGGHSREILNRAGIESHLSAMDRDPEAQIRADNFRKEFGNRFRFYAKNFSQLDEVEEAPFDGILMDIGVSSFQLDNCNRGFSFRNDAVADMRMNFNAGISAADFLETASKEELIEAIRDFGEEAQWKKIIRAIEDARGTGVLSTTCGIAKLIEDTIGRRPGASIHPATRSFQGIRIAVNNELGELKEALPKALSALKKGGVLVVISFHSLEDRIVKRFFNIAAGRPENRFDSRPQDERIQEAELLTRKAIRPSEDEIFQNPRCRSSRLRAIKKL